MSAFSLVEPPRLLSLPLRRRYNAPLPVDPGEPGDTPELRYDAYRQSFSARKHSMSQLLRTV
jgi:hypothetical protein